MAITITSRFKPFTYEELIRPLLQYREAYDKVEADYTTLATQAEAWKDAANRETNPEAYKAYTKYTDDLNKIIEDFSKGMNLNNSNTLNMKRRYASEIMPIAKAATRLKELEDERRKVDIQDPSRLWQRESLTIDELMKNPSLNFGENYSRRDLAAQASTMAKNIAQGLTSYGLGKPIDKYTNTFIQKHGLTAEDVQSYIQGNPTAAAKVLQSIHDTVLNNSGIKDWKSGRAEKLAKEAINEGMWSAIGPTTVQAMENYSARQALQLANQKKLLDYKGNQNTQEGPGLLPIDPEPIIVAKDKERQKAVNNFGKYFTVGKDGQTYLTEEGLKEYRAVGKTYATGPASTAVSAKNAHSSFRNFLDSIGAGKYIGKGKNIRPATIGRIWNNYIKNGHTADAMKYTEYNIKIHPSDQANLAEAISLGYKNNPYKIVTFNKDDDPNNPYDKWKVTGEISQAQITKGKYTPIAIQGSAYGLTSTLQGKDGDIIRIKLPESVGNKNQENAVSAYRAADYYSNKAAEASKKLKVDKINEARQAYRDGKLYEKPLTEEQKETIRQWNAADIGYTNSVNNAQGYMSQINNSIKTTPTQYKGKGY